MNKNLIMAFVAILATIAFFNSKFYYNNVLRRPHPAEIAQRQIQQKEDERKLAEEKTVRPVDTSTIKDTLQKETLIDTAAVEEETTNIDTLWVETDKLIVGISTLGGRIISARTKEYTYNNEQDDGNYIELIEDPSLGGGNLQINGVDFDEKTFTPKQGEGTRSISLQGRDSMEVSLFNSDPEVGTIEKVYTFHKDDYQVGLDIVSNRLDGKRVSVGWEGGIKESEESFGGQSDRYGQRQVHVYARGDIERISRKKPGTEERTGDFKWVAVTSKYFMVSLVADQLRSVDLEIEAFQTQPPDEQNTINYGFASKRIADGNREGYWFYVGPTKMSQLKEYDIGLDNVLFGGWKWFLWANIWFPALCKFVLWLLTSLQGFVGDYGVAILLLTIVSKIITFPMTQSSMKSMSKMKDVQPKITKIRERYKKDPKKMNEKVMELYREEGINPFNPGCLPMILQMPIFISLFVVLRKAIELRGAGTVMIPWVSDLSRPEVLLSIDPISIPFYGSNIALLPILMAVLTFFQNKATMKDPNQKAMVYIMPLIMLVFFNNFPSGVVLYWTFQSGLGIIQQKWLDRGKAKAA